MNNDRFDDVGVITAIALLKKDGFLHRDDHETLKSKLKSAWGRAAEAAYMSGDEQAFAPYKDVLRRFAKVFG